MRVFWLVLLTLGCGSDPEAPADAGFADAGFLDAEPADAFAPDGTPGDAGPPPDSGVVWATSACAPCDTGCPGGTCLTNANDEQFCADSCAAPLLGCVDGFACVDVSANMSGQNFCIPPGATCAAPGTGFGSACYGTRSGCVDGLDTCQSDFFALGYCTRRCQDDCPPGYTCAPGDDGEPTCLDTALPFSERCALAPQTACAVDSDCVGPAFCVRSSPLLPGVCALPCNECDGDCLATHRGPACLPEVCACHGSAADGRDLLAEALLAIDHSRCSLGFLVHDWASVPTDLLRDPYRLSFFNAVHREPLLAPPWGRQLVHGLDQLAIGDPAAQAAGMLTRLATLVDAPVQRVMPDATDPVAPLVTAMERIITLGGGSPNRAQLAADAADIPMELQLAMAQALEGLRLALDARRRVLGADRTARDLFEFGPAFVAARADNRGLDPSSESVRNLLNGGIDYGALYGGGVDLLYALEQARLADFAVAPTQTASAAVRLSFNQMTPFGRVAIGDGGNSIYEPNNPALSGDWLLLLDLGGHDVYRVNAGGNQSANNWASALIDLSGDDRYLYPEVPHPRDGQRLPADAGGRYNPQRGPSEDYGPISFSNVARQGGARAGIAVLMDLGQGEDHYRSLRLSQGVGIFGAGLLIDDGGDDLYETETVAQGAGSFGIGILLDLGGDDVRKSYQMAQGFAFARAAGLLYDVAGNDQYLLDPGDPAVGGDPLYISGQRPGQANTSLGQGFGFGRRADFTDRAFMSGGVGLLIDANGDDRYQGSIFTQGGGFWFGTGILADHRGNDQYDGLWYAMGTGAHYALGLLLEGDGNDIYGAQLPRVNVTIAGGHDYSAAFVIDDAGDDHYLGSRITLGSGNANGIGVLIDNAGDDRYEARSSYSIGSAGILESNAPGSPRRKVDSVGVFIDADGNDQFSRTDMMLGEIDNDATWLQNQSTDPELMLMERGVGVDGSGDSTLSAR